MNRETTLCIRFDRNGIKRRFLKSIPETLHLIFSFTISQSDLSNVSSDSGVFHKKMPADPRKIPRA